MSSMPCPPEPHAVEALEALDADRLVVLPANCDTVAAEDLQVRLVLAADHDNEVRIDASAVDNVGQAVLQLLLAAKREADAGGQPFTIERPSIAFTERVDACRLSEALGLDLQKDAAS